MNPPGLVRGDVVVNRLDADGLGLWPVGGGPPELARGDSNPFWAGVRNVDNYNAFRTTLRADEGLLQSVAHLLKTSIVELDGARFAETVAVPVGVYSRLLRGSKC